MRALSAKLLTTLALIALAPGMPASAQPASEATGRASALSATYSRVSNLMDSAAKALASDPAGALITVEDAQDAFSGLEGGLSGELEAGAKAAFTSARAAVGRGSSADLTAQSLQVKAILSRAMLDALLANPHDVTAATTLAGAIARATAMADASAKQLTSAAAGGDLSRARLIVEQHQARTIERALRDALSAVSTEGAFRATARAASAFLVVQDSPNAGRLSAGEFTRTLAKIASGDAKAYRASIEGLLAAATAFGGASPATSTPPAAAPEQPASAPAARQPTATATPAPINPSTAPSRPQAAAPNPGVPDAAGTPASARAAIDAVVLHLAAAYALVANDDFAAGHARAEQAAAIFRSKVLPALTRADEATATRASRVFDALPSQGNLLAPDLGVLLVEAEGARQALGGAVAAGSRQSLTAAAQPTWAGWVRGLLFLFSCALFAYPVYLMNLSFGGRNPHWRLVSAALLLLFLAPVLESLAWVGRQVASLTGLGFLGALGALSILNNPLAQIVWALSMLVAVGLAIAGFRGIAAQFGLIGPAPRGTVLGDPTPAPALAGGPMLVKRPSTETVVEWDEEL